MCQSDTHGLPAESGAFGWFCPACSLPISLLCHEMSHWYSHGGVRNPHLKAYQVLLFWVFLLVQALQGRARSSAELGIETGAWSCTGGMH